MYFLFVDDSKFYWIKFSAYNKNDCGIYLYTMWINLLTKEPITMQSSANDTHSYCSELNLFSKSPPAPPDTSDDIDSINVRICILCT